MENNYSGQDEIAMLIYKHMTGTLTEEEKNKLENWIMEAAANRAFFDEVTEPEALLLKLVDHYRALKDVDMDALWQRLMNKGSRPEKTRRPFVNHYRKIG